jgi:RNA polymerase sigma-B factor
MSVLAGNAARPGPWERPVAAQRQVAGTPRPSRDTDNDAAARALLTLLADLPAGSADHARVRQRLIEMYLPMAQHLARRFRNRGEPIDDLVQVANVGLIKSVDGFDVGRGPAFTSYAVPVIVGELKRYFRDKSWDVRVPRRLQELCMAITRITDELTQRLSRSPTVADLAIELGVSEEEVIEGLDCSNAYRALSLHAPVAGDQTNTELGELLGGTDRDLESVEDREALLPLIACLPAREQRIISLRFFGNLTQSQIAAEVGVSQMHVSRLLSHALGVLRDRLLA